MGPASHSSKLESPGTRPAPPEDQRKYNAGHDAFMVRNVDAFLEFAYQNLAGPLADAQVILGDVTAQRDVILPNDDEDGAMEEHFIKWNLTH